MTTPSVNLELSTKHIQAFVFQDGEPASGDERPDPLSRHPRCEHFVQVVTVLGGAHRFFVLSLMFPKSGNEVGSSGADARVQCSFRGCSLGACLQEICNDSHLSTLQTSVKRVWGPVREVARRTPLCRATPFAHKHATVVVSRQRKKRRHQVHQGPQGCRGHEPHVQVTEMAHMQHVQGN